MTGDATRDARRKGRSCPICGKPATEEAKPFCSRRCANIDLGRWLKGVYTIPSRPAADVEAEDKGEEAPREPEVERPRRKAKN
jgi:endogenous inhibitor of DNA gyrase (YacG/DUF329 family)